MEKKRIRDFGIVPGRVKTGKRNAITDVPGVLVGHCTVNTEENHTGVTVIIPGPDNAFANHYTPFARIEREKRIVEICDSLSIGAAVENMILTATGYGLGTLWIANTCFAYNELIEFIGTDNQLTGIVAVGAANEAPPKRPRKALRDVVEYR